MPYASNYRTRALEFLQKAHRSEGEQRDEYLTIALAYMDLADAAERAKTGAGETPDHPLDETGIGRRPILP